MNIDFNIKLSDYDYDLPKEKIAEFPLENREDSNLLIVDKQDNTIKHDVFRNIDDYLDKNSLIYLNKTKVIHARLLMKKITGGFAEILILNPVAPSNDPQIVMNSKGECIWECLVGGRRIRKDTELLLLNDLNINFKAIVVDKNEQNALVKFQWNDNLTFSEILHKIGHIPLPPYIKREDTDLDKIRYQTVFAKIDGSVAAPTAGLHFTEDKITKLKNKGIDFDEIILHIGLGTFQPVKSQIQNHKMHNEKIFFSQQNLRNLINAIENKKKIIATGTTSLRTIESIYWLAVKSIKENKPINQLGQFDWTDLKDLNVSDALKDYLNLLTKNAVETVSAETRLFIIPGYQFKIVNGLITNFHMPKSTLILLVAAFLGKELWLQSYNEALNNNYRFLSYGDTSLLLR